MIPTTVPYFAVKHARGFAFTIRRALLFVAPFLLFPAPGQSQVTPQEKTREPLGSLSSAGEVYLNDAAAPVEITIFSGDRVRVGAAGSATFSMTGKGLLKISPSSQVLFAGKYEYTAELEAGAVVMNSVSGPHGFTLRIGNDVVVAPSKEHTAAASIDKAADGSFLVTCSEGPVAVLALLGGAGQFLESGQAVSVAPNGELVSIERQSSTSAAAKSTSGAQKHRSNNKVWGFVGLAAAAGAAGAAVALSHNGGAKQQTVTLTGP